MPDKNHVIELINSTRIFADKCDPLAVKRMVTHMLTIQNSFEDGDINQDDRIDLLRSVRDMSSEFSEKCKCLSM